MKETENDKELICHGWQADRDLTFFKLTLISITNPNKANSESPEKISSSTAHTQQAAVYRLLW